MDRTHLEALTREDLVTRAEAEGVSRARSLTRPELIDELLIKRTEGGREAAPLSARGLFGRARDLLVKIVESGLHLPDAATRHRHHKEDATGNTDPLPTITLAEIYATQGHRKRALEIVEAVLESEPDNPAGLALLAQLTSAAPVTTNPRRREGCLAIPIEPTSWRVAHAIDPAILQTFESKWPGGGLSICLVTVAPARRGSQLQRRFFPLSACSGETTCPHVSPTDIVRVAVGWRVAEEFIPIAHSVPLDRRANCSTPKDLSDLVCWTSEGPSPVSSRDHDADWISEMLAHTHRRSNG